MSGKARRQHYCSFSWKQIVHNRNQKQVVRTKKCSHEVLEREKSLVSEREKSLVTRDSIILQHQYGSQMSNNNIHMSDVKQQTPNVKQAEDM